MINLNFYRIWIYFWIKENAVKILVIEDEKMLCETIVSYLEGEGYRCEQAGTVEMGMEKVNLYEYDCMLVDIY